MEVSLPVEALARRTCEGTARREEEEADACWGAQWRSALFAPFPRSALVRCHRTRTRSAVMPFAELARSLPRSNLPRSSAADGRG